MLSLKPKDQEGNGYPLQYSWPENSMDRGAWQATLDVVAKSQTQLSDYHSLITLKGNQKICLRKFEVFG